MDNPPVNALPVPGWFELADAITRARARPERARRGPAGRGPGLQRRRRHQGDAGDRGLSTRSIGANRGCFAAFAAVYDCAVPGDRRGATASASAAASASSATPTSSSPPTTRRSACPRSTAARSAPPPTSPGSCRSTRCGRWSTRLDDRRRQPSCTHYGSVLAVVPRAELRDAALRGRRARSRPRHPTVIRAAKESLNGIDPVDVQAQLPLRAGLHVRAQPHRRRRRAPRRVRREAATTDAQRWRQAHDRSTTSSPSCETGMTIGIGGWGSRRKPMALVRAILRSPVTRPHRRVSYGGPDVGLLCAAGKVRKVVYGFVSLDSIPLEPHFRAARAEPGRSRRAKSTRACSWSVCTPRHSGCRSCRPAPGSAPTC